MTIISRDVSFATILGAKAPYLTPREQKALENSWAKVFAEEIFPKIDEKPFAVLCSDKASRPNTPVNVIIGACIIKELFDYSDDEMVEGLMLDLRLQYALQKPVGGNQWGRGNRTFSCPAVFSLLRLNSLLFNDTLFSRAYF